MNALTASLLVRQHMALMDEGIGPKQPWTGDRHILQQAAEVCLAAGDLLEFTVHDAWDSGLIPEDDPRHLGNCGDLGCYRKDK